MAYFFHQNYPTGKYSELKPDRILSTLTKLRQRIGERFPGSGLGQVADELRQVADAIVLLVERLQKPLWALRVLTGLAIAALIGLAVWLVVMTIRLVPAGESGLMDLLQGAESAINEVIFLGLAIFFFATLEVRYKRNLALRSLHRLRSIAHVVDMHQLTKDPAFLLSAAVPTTSSPTRNLTASELTRYLDYCSELLAITSKLAALHAQNFQDTHVLTAVNEVESLTQGLSGKIWQKIMILDTMATSPEKLPGNETVTPAAAGFSAKSTAAATKSKRPK